MAAKVGIHQRARSGAIHQAPDFFGNVGPVSPFALEELAHRGIECKNRDRFPRPVSKDEFLTHGPVIAMDKDEHAPMIRDIFPEFQDVVTYWDIKDIGFEAPVVACDRMAAYIERMVAVFASPRS